MSNPRVGILALQGGFEAHAKIVRSLGAVLPLHGFGCKTTGLASYGRWITSADSMAWSLAGRREHGCHPGHASEANCLRYALDWHARILDSLDTAEQPSNSTCSPPQAWRLTEAVS